MSVESKININMNGEEYIKYRNSKRLNRKHIIIISMVAITIIGILLVGLLLDSFFYVPATESGGIITSYLEGANIAVKGGWQSLLLYFGIVLVPFIAISWLFHGVGFYIVR